MEILIAGGSGFLGRHLSAELRMQGHHVTSLVRREARGADEASWDPYAGSGRLDQSLVEAADVVINLAGSPTAGNPHSEKWAQQLEESRVTTTSVLARAVARAHDHGAPTAYLAGNGISFYGDHGDLPVDESSGSDGDAFLTKVTRVWQAAADPAVEAGARVCILRTAPVIDQHSPPLKMMLLPFKLGLGVKLGDGRQYFPIISLRDWVNAVVRMAGDDAISGPVNLCCPTTPTNGEYTKALARAVGRKARLAVPSLVLDKAAGRMSDEVLGSIRAVPQALLDAGFEFEDDDARDVIAAGLAS